MNKLACWQINLHHCRAANINLAVEVGNLGCFVILIQEPWVFKNSIGGLPTDWRVHRDTFSNGPRACIATSPGLQGLLLSQFTSRDSTAILIESGCRSEPNIVLASFYMSHDSPIPPPLLWELITFYQNKDLGLDQSSLDYCQQEMQRLPLVRTLTCYPSTSQLPYMMPTMLHAP